MFSGLGCPASAKQVTGSIPEPAKKLHGFFTGVKATVDVDFPSLLLHLRDSADNDVADLA